MKTVENINCTPEKKTKMTKIQFPFSKMYYILKFQSCIEKMYSWQQLNKTWVQLLYGPFT